MYTSAIFYSKSINLLYQSRTIGWLHTLFMAIGYIPGTQRLDTWHQIFINCVLYDIIII